jgi:hypothetical protein
MEIRFRTVDGVRVHCAEAAGVSAPSILLTSPWPESVNAFAPICGKLVLVNAGHFVWEEGPGEYTSLIADMVTDGYRTAAADGP